MKEEFTPFLESSSNGTLNDHLPKEENELLKILLETQNQISQRVKSDIQFAPPIIKCEEAGIIFPNTINVIQGKTGTHKSRLAEIYVAILLAIFNIELLGFKRQSTTSDYHIVYVDTERNLKDQFPYAIQQILHQANFQKDTLPNNFDFFSLVNIEREQRFAALEKYIDHIRQKFSDKHLVIVLDVVTDCVSNFNDPRESMKLVDLMNSMINRSDVTFIGVIHENPGQGSKARGHLGTELMNKASTQIQIAHDGKDGNLGIDFYKVSFLKTRRSKRPEPFHVYFSKEENKLVLADSTMTQSLVNGKKKKANVGEVAQYLLQILIEEMSRAELVDELVEHFGAGKNTILDRLKQIVENQIVIEGADNKYQLTKEKRGKETFYQLKSIA